MKQLVELLASCTKCRKEYGGNVAILVAEDVGLTDEQIVWVLAYLAAQHKEH